MVGGNRKSLPLLLLGLAPIVAAVTSNGRIGDALGLSGDFWTGALMGTGIGLLVIMIVLGVRSARTS